MAYSNEFGLFQALEQVLKEAEKPMTNARLWVSPVDLPGQDLYLMYNNEENFVPITDAGDIADGVIRWRRLSGIHYDAWFRLTAEQQLVLAERAKVLAISRRLMGE